MPVDLQHGCCSRLADEGVAAWASGPLRGDRRAGGAAGVDRSPSPCRSFGAARASGVLVQMDDFYVTLRDADGTVRTVRRGPGVKITKTNPLQAHIDLLDRLTDTQIHDLVAHLETLK